MRTAISICVTGALALILCVRCSEPVHQCGLDIQCGQGDRLVNESPPGVTNASGQDTQNQQGTQSISTDAASLCTPIADPDAACSVSFNNDILQKMLGAAGTLGCAKTQCHSASTNTQPIIDPTQVQATYNNLYNVNTGTAHSYINPCSTDPTMSDIVGNLANPAVTGTGSHMPQDNTALPGATDLATITTWVKCGAPNN